MKRTLGTEAHHECFILVAAPTSDILVIATSLSTNLRVALKQPLTSVNLQQADAPVSSISQLKRKS